MLPLALIPHWGAAWLSLMFVSDLSGVRYTASMVYFLDLVPPNRQATTAGRPIAPVPPTTNTFMFFVLS